MSDNADEILYDVRLIDRHVRKGLINRKDVDKRIKEIPDVEAQGEYATFDAGRAGSAGDDDEG